MRSRAARYRARGLVRLPKRKKLSIIAKRQFPASTELHLLHFEKYDRRLPKPPGGRAGGHSQGCRNSVIVWSSTAPGGGFVKKTLMLVVSALCGVAVGAGNNPPAADDVDGK